ncbi:MAG: DUF3131 domain-containing protein [Cyanobacteriota bacterium]|nr:DUF3131 domain-containing protein [Cyanobacteriota bacterium]
MISPATSFRLKQIGRWLLLGGIFWIGLTLGSPTWLAQVPGGSPLSAAEQAMAERAWLYFENNINRTGLANSVANYPSATLWEQGNLAVAVMAAHDLGIISDQAMQQRLNQLLQGLEKLPLFEGDLPNKAYNTETGIKTDYGNNPVERGIGFSGLDMGRLINALFVVKTQQPQFSQRIDRLLQGWDLDRLYQQQDLYGAVVTPDGETLPVQEGRHGYLEYAARSGVLLGRDMAKALDPPVEVVDVYGIPIKNDQRRFQEFNAVAYTVTEAPALEIIELGTAGRPQVWEEFCQIYKAQKRRWQDTQKWTAVTEDHITGRLYPDTPFLYNTLISDGIPWAVVTESGQRFDERRTISTKAAVLLSVLQPSDDPLNYGQKLFEVVQPLFNEGGYWAGKFEMSGEPNDILTNNTNSILLEALWAKQRGRSLITDEAFPSSCGDRVKASGYVPSQASNNVPSQGDPSSPSRSLVLGQSPSERLSPGGSAPLHQFFASASCEVVQTTPQGPLSLSALPEPAQGIQPAQCASASPPPAEQPYAQAAWNYFQHYRDPQTGLVASRSDLKATTLWGLGDSIAATQLAERMGLIESQEFDQLMRQVLGTTRVLPTVEGLPHIAYATTTGQPVTLGGVAALPSEWDAMGMARLFVALAGVSQCHPEYRPAIDDLLMQWRYYALIHAASLFSGKIGQRPQLECSFYSSYAIPGLNLWGMDLQEPTYQRISVAGQSLDVGCDRLLTSDPLLYRRLELGKDPTTDRLLAAHWQAQSPPTGGGTVALSQPPFWIRNTLWAGGEAGIVKGIDGNSYPQLASVSTGAAFAWWALGLPQAEVLRASAIERTLLDKSLGFQDGYLVSSQESVGVGTSQGNYLVLAALAYAQQGSLIQNFQPGERWQQRGWWIGG